MSVRVCVGVIGLWQTFRNEVDLNVFHPGKKSSHSEEHFWATSLSILLVVLAIQCVFFSGIHVQQGGWTISRTAYKCWVSRYYPVVLQCIFWSCCSLSLTPSSKLIYTKVIGWLLVPEPHQLWLPGKPKSLHWKARYSDGLQTDNLHWGTEESFIKHVQRW